MKIVETGISQSNAVLPFMAPTAPRALVAMHRMGDGDGELGSTHHFEFDGFRLAADEHAHAMIDGLVSRPIVGQNEGEVDKGIPTIKSVVPV
jgi:hypothetical protein